MFKKIVGKILIFGAKPVLSLLKKVCQSAKNVALYSVLSRPGQLGLLIANIVFLCQGLQTLKRARFSASMRCIQDLDEASLRQLFTQLPMWIKYAEYEQASFLNEAFKTWWGNVEQLLSQAVRGVEKDLQSNLPSAIGSITFEKVFFGGQAPFFAGVKATRSEDMSLTLDVDLRWNGSPDIVVKLSAMSQQRSGYWVSDIVGDILPAMYVGLDVFQFSGLLRIRFIPSSDPKTFLTGLSLCFLKQPYIDFNIKLLGGDLMSLPALSRWLRSQIMDEGLMGMVFPKQVNIEFSKEDDGGQEEKNHPAAWLHADARPLGVLTIQITQALLPPRTVRGISNVVVGGMVASGDRVHPKLQDDFQADRAYAPGGAGVAQSYQTHSFFDKTFHLVVFGKDKEVRVYLAGSRSTQVQAEDVEPGQYSMVELAELKLPVTEILNVYDVLKSEKKQRIARLRGILAASVILTKAARIVRQHNSTERDGYDSEPDIRKPFQQSNRTNKKKKSGQKKGGTFLSGLDAGRTAVSGDTVGLKHLKHDLQQKEEHGHNITTPAYSQSLDSVSTPSASGKGYITDRRLELQHSGDQIPEINRYTPESLSTSSLQSPSLTAHQIPNEEALNQSSPPTPTDSNYDQQITFESTGKIKKKRQKRRGLRRNRSEPKLQVNKEQKKEAEATSLDKAAIMMASDGRIQSGLYSVGNRGIEAAMKLPSTWLLMQPPKSAYFNSTYQFNEQRQSPSLEAVMQNFFGNLSEGIFAKPFQDARRKNVFGEVEEGEEEEEEDGQDLPGWVQDHVMLEAKRKGRNIQLQYGDEICEVDQCSAVMRLKLGYQPVLYDFEENIKKLGNASKSGVLVIELIRTLIYGHTFSRCAVKIQIGNKNQQTSVRERWGSGKESIQGGTCSWDRVLTFPIDIPDNQKDMETMQLVIAEVDSKITIRFRDWFSWFSTAAGSHGIALGKTQVPLSEINIGVKSQDFVRTLFMNDPDNKSGYKSVGEVVMKLAILRTAKS